MTTSSDDDSRYAVDIRVFLTVIVISMTVSFGIGVGLGPAADDAVAAFVSSSASAAGSGGKVTELPHVTSVKVAEPEDLTFSTAGDDLHEPAGQHLLVDIKGIESDFLDSESRLAKAMVDTVTAAGLNMLSYHCHKLIPMGVSCVGVLLESHISFHTWPDEGVITLDLFTCGNKPLIPVVKTIQELFGIGENTTTQWSHELRGFRNKDKGSNPTVNDHVGMKGTDNYAILDHNSDLSQMIWSPIDCPHKEQIVSTLTKYQRVDIWDVVGLEETPTYEDALKHNLQPGDPRWTTSELVSPTRYLFLDGLLQSETGTHKEYHEALVHPGMFAHTGPKKVAIIGGAEGGTLREVLKHKTVEKVTMVEIDGELIDITTEHMSMLSDCTDLIGRADRCFDDKSLNLVIDDAKNWLTSRTEDEDGEFDVMIVDALEPETEAAIVKDLYDAEHFQEMMDSLSENGILVISIGTAPTILDPRPDIGFNAPREKMFNTLESLPDVEAMFVYEDPHSGFLEPRGFMVVCKSDSCREQFYATSDEIDYEIYDRIVKTKSKSRALTYFDGVTHLGYQVAPKAWETVYCRREPTPFECAYRHLDFNRKIFEFNFENEEENPFKLTADWEGEGDDRKVTATHAFAKVDIPKGSYVMPEHLASSLRISEKAIANLRESIGYGGVSVIEDFVEFIDEFGHASQSSGTGQEIVEIGASYLMRSTDDESEANIDRWIPAHPAGKRPKYSPVYERHRLSFDVFIVATKDIPAGGELVKLSTMWDKP